MSAPLPDFWSEKKDPRGKTYYSNRQTRKTSWTRPVASISAVAVPPPPAYSASTGETRQPVASYPGAAPGLAPAYDNSTANTLESRPSVSSGDCCSPRVAFWVAFVLGWVVWGLAVVASTDNHWLELGGIPFLAAGDQDILDCESGFLCIAFKGFTAAQFIAVGLASIALVVLMFAPFVPAGRGCCSPKSLVSANSGLMIGFVIFQILATAFVIGIREHISSIVSDSYSYGLTYGGTFVVAVVAILLGILQVVFARVFGCSSGDGPSLMCCHDTTASNHDPTAYEINQPKQQVRTLLAATTPRTTSCRCHLQSLKRLVCGM
ncbi:unnamed protein product [Pylaiella littoralis]